MSFKDGECRHVNIEYYNKLEVCSDCGFVLSYVSDGNEELQDDKQRSFGWHDDCGTFVDDDYYF